MTHQENQNLKEIAHLLDKIDDRLDNVEINLQRMDNEMKPFLNAFYGLGALRSFALWVATPIITIIAAWAAIKGLLK